MYAGGGGGGGRAATVNVVGKLATDAGAKLLVGNLNAEVTTLDIKARAASRAHDGRRRRRWRRCEAAASGERRSDTVLRAHAPPSRRWRPPIPRLALRTRAACSALATLRDGASSLALCDVLARHRHSRRRSCLRWLAR